MRRTGPLLQRVGLRALRSIGVATWQLGERLGIDLDGATEAPGIEADPVRNTTFDALIADARTRDGVVDVDMCRIRRTSS